MKKRRFSVEQIVGVLKQAEVGVPVTELIRKVGISEQTFYRWKKHYVGLELDQARQMKQLQEENSRLKQLVAELSLGQNGVKIDFWATRQTDRQRLRGIVQRNLPGRMPERPLVRISGRGQTTNRGMAAGIQ